MRVLGRLPLRQRMLVIATISGLAAVVVTAAAILVFEATTFQTRMLDELGVETELLRPNLRAALSFLDRDAASADLAALSGVREIRLAILNDRWGEVFAAYGRDAEAADHALPALESEGHEFREGYLDLWTPIDEEGERIGTIFIRRDLPPIHARVLQYGPMLGAVLFALASAALTLLLFLRHSVTAPLHRLSLAAESVIRDADYSVRVETSGQDEVSRLSAAFNEMLGKIEQREADLRSSHARQAALQERLNQSQKMESIGQLAGGVAHDFNNMLTVIGGASEFLLEELPPGSRLVPIVKSGQQAASQAADLTRQLLAFARKQQIEITVTDPGALVRRQERMLSRLIGEDVEFEVLVAEDVWPIEVDPNQIAQVLMNLCCNARDAMPGGGRLTISVVNHLFTERADGMPAEARPGEYVRIAVRDTGRGIDAETQKRIFEPFFTTKGHGRGTGLGLSTCFGIVSQSGGFIDVSSSPGHGATFNVYIPRSVATPVDPLTKPGEAGDAPRGCETILVVEDNDLVRATTVKILRARGYETLEASGGREAIRLVEESRASIDLLLTDVIMPEMSGREVAHRLRESMPALKVLYISGYTNEIVGERDLAQPNTGFLSKPYRSVVLAETVRALLDGASVTTAVDSSRTSP